MQKRFLHLAHEDWPQGVAALVVDMLVRGGVVAKAHSPRAMALVAEQFEAVIKKQEFVLPVEDDHQQERADRAWSEKIAPLLIDRLKLENLLSEAEESRAKKTAAREILLRLTMEDRPPRFAR